MDLYRPAGEPASMSGLGRAMEVDLVGIPVLDATTYLPHIPMGGILWSVGYPCRSGHPRDKRFMAIETGTRTRASTVDIDFAVDGMTCASCVRRVETALNKVEGVGEASVNLATERAHVTLDPAKVTADQLAATVKKAGYAPGTITLPGPTGVAPGPITGMTFDIEGMTCASCVRRVEKALAKVDGVQEVSVNLATERATVQVDPGRVEPDALVKAVVAAGYQATPRLPEPEVAVATAEGPTAAEREDLERRARRDAEIADLKRKSLVSLVIGAAMMLAMYLPLPISELSLAPILLR